MATGFQRGRSGVKCAGCGAQYYQYDITAQDGAATGSVVALCENCGRRSTFEVEAAVARRLCSALGTSKQAVEAHQASAGITAAALSAQREQERESARQQRAADAPVVKPVTVPKGSSPAEVLASHLRDAYARLAAELDFDPEGRGRKLDPRAVVITTAPVKQQRVLGHFRPEGWVDAAGARIHEINLSAQHLRDRSPIEVLSTLAHEMAHEAQERWGAPSRRGYHNAEWARIMRQVGLVGVSNKDEKKETGESCHHRIEPDGAFARLFRRLPAALRQIRYAARAEEAAEAGGKHPRSKVAYSCPEGHMRVWGRPDLRIICGECSRKLGQEE